MSRLLVPCAALLALAVSACGGDGGSCDLPEQWSSARSGDLCQVNFFTTPEHAVYCGGSTGAWNCACGPIADNPLEFTSEDFCDLEPEGRACQAIARCGFPL
ncbi:MAG TPA: hypothetical protein VM261_14935 [Kofleriaceae bacterium]|nr:hypothetical protein [Kofleriaceae bacterium]